MIFKFDGFTLDSGKVELRRHGAPVALEPQVFALLLLLVAHRERMVSKDEIVEAVWGGRIVSESAVTSRIKSARRALGDDGKAQRLIRTVHGRGFRFVVEVEVITQPAMPASAPSAEAACTAETPIISSLASRPSIAVLPFSLIGMAGSHAAIADAIPHDLIAELARLRWLFVIARGSSFRFRAPDPDVRQIGSALNVRYCLSGAVDIFGNAISVSVELTDTYDGGVLWGDSFNASIDEIHEIRSQIVVSIIAALELQIPLNEARKARLMAPENLDAWSVFHLGLLHFYRFTKQDNLAAAGLFRRAIESEPGFARAHAGLSSTHFQNAFLDYTGDSDGEVENARRFAEVSVDLDPLDPLANFTMGRAFWLKGDLDSSLGWLDRSIALSPNFAQGIYARAWADTVSGRGQDGQVGADGAMALSPLDPFLYAMLGTRSLSHAVRGEDSEAAYWGEQAAHAPGAHVLIALIAVIGHALNGDHDKAARWAESATRRRAEITQAHFFRSFPFPPGAVQRRIAGALGRHGF